MVKWRKNKNLSKALAREGKAIAKGVAQELLSISTLKVYRLPRRFPRKRSRS